LIAKSSNVSFLIHYLDDSLTMGPRLPLLVNAFGPSQKVKDPATIGIILDTRLPEENYIKSWHSG